MTSLGMPGLPPPVDPVWKRAWDNALYGPAGHLRSHPLELTVPMTSLIALVSSLTAGGKDEIALLGSAGTVAPEFSASRHPVRFDVPEGFTGLVLAVDWLAHVPTHVVELDPEGHPRLVHVSPLTGRETLGARLSESSVPQSIGLWLEEWWPIVDYGVGARAEVGTSRDAAWSGVVRRLGAGGRAVAVEPCHLLTDRPFGGSLSSPGGRPIPDGNRDVAAGVALDAVAEISGGSVVRTGGLTYVVNRAGSVS